MPDRSPPSPRWCLLRLDDNGNQFVVRDNLTRAAAEALLRELEARGHKQSYWLRPQPGDGQDAP
jgi:hypothetical protein